MQYLSKWILVLSTMTWAGVIFIGPVLTYNEGTFTDAKVTVLASPYAESNTLKYKWEGDVYRSCDIVIDRYILTSENVIIELKPSPLLSGVPRENLGYTEFPLNVQTPEKMPAGASIYQATERPRCNWLQRMNPPKIPYPPVEFTVTDKAKEKSSETDS